MPHPNGFVQTASRFRVTLPPRATAFSRWIRVTLTLLAVTSQLPMTAWGQLPGTRLDAVFPTGARAGQSVEVTLFGADLDDVSRMVFAHPGITATQKMSEPGPFDEGPQPVENVFTVTVQPDVPPGQYAVRCQGKYGLSNPRTFVIDSLDEVLETEPNQSTEEAVELTLPVVVQGQLNVAADVDLFRFEGQAGQRLILDGQSRRIDSPADLVLTVAAADGRILAESRQEHAGDPLIDLRIPENGTIFVRVHDSLYRGGTDHVYRLVISSRPHIDMIFPPAGTPGSNAEYTIYGRNLPGGENTDLQLNGQPLQQLKVQIPIPGDITDRLSFSERLDPHQAGLDGVEYRVDSPAGRSNPILLTTATERVVLEPPDNDTPQTAARLELPCEIAGQFYPQRDQDWYVFEAKSGDELWIEVYSHRLGLPTDPSLLIQRVTTTDAGDEQINQVATVDDVTSTVRGKEFDHRSNDPAYHFTAPADGTYRILVVDTRSAVTSDPRLVYRLAVRAAQPDFRLAAAPVDVAGSVLMRRGERAAIRVTAFRQDGYEGEITVTTAGLPDGVSSEPVIIGPGSDYAYLVLTAADDAPHSVGTIQIIGEGRVHDAEVRRTARVGRVVAPVPFQQPNSNVASIPARLTDRIQLTVSESESTLVAITAGDGKLLETARGGIVKIPYTVKRAEGAGGNLTAFPMGLPPNITAPQVGIGSNEKGEFELRMLATTPPGTYSFCLATMAQGIQYSRNPEAAAAAKARQEKLAETLKQANENSQAAQKAAQEANTALTQANNQLTAARTADTTARKAASDAETALKTATDALAAVQKQSAAAPDDAQLKQQVTDAQAALKAATEQSQSASAAAAEAARKLEEATVAQKAAEEAKATADKEAQAARDFAQAAQQEKQRADQKANQAQQQANKRGINFNTPSNPVTISIAEFPIKHTGPAAASIKQGESVELAFQVERLFDFKANISVQPQLPGGVGGLQIPNITIADAQTEGTVKITAAANATAGEHEMKFRLQMNFNGQNLILEHPLKLTVVQVEATK